MKSCTVAAGQMFRGYCAGPKVELSCDTPARFADTPVEAPRADVRRQIYAPQHVKNGLDLGFILQKSAQGRKTEKEP